MGKHIKGLSPDAEAALYNYGWPGNVRELRNVIERAFDFRSDAYIQEYELSMDAPGESIENSFYTANTDKMAGSGVAAGAFNLTKNVERYESGLIARAAAETNSLHELAEVLGISRQSLSYKLKKYGIKI